MGATSSKESPSDTKSSKSTNDPESSDEAPSKLLNAPLDTPRLIALLLLTAASTLTLTTLYHHRLRRIPTAPLIPPQYYRTRSLFGTVSSVGDGDNFRLYHTPGGRILGWGWLRFPFFGDVRRVPTSRAELKDQTIHVRLAGVDAPELPHFGHEGQAGGEEARTWLRNYLLGRKVRAWLWRRDQYERVVATAFVWRYGLRRDVGAEMLRRGLATVYEARTGVEFGGKEEKYRQLERKAKEKRRGIWASGGGESPREFKNRISTESESNDRDGGNDKGAEKTVGWMSWLGGWFGGSGTGGESTPGKKKGNGHGSGHR